MENEPKTILQVRLQELLDKQKRKPAPFAKEIGLGESFIRDIIRGKTKSPRAEGLAVLAEALGTTSDYLQGHDKDGELSGPALLQSNEQLPFAGTVQAGLFLAVDEYFNQDPESVPSHVRQDPSHSKARQYAWRARGDSMNQAGILDGMWVVGADASDYIDVYGDIETGDLVVVERVRFQGSERELTVKEVHFFKDRYELRPVSSNTDHQPIAVAHDHSVTSDGEEIKIIAVVLTAYANLRRRK